MGKNIINQKKLIKFHIINIIFFISQFLMNGTGSISNVNNATNINEIEDQIIVSIYLLVVIFFLLIYPIIYLKLEKIKSKIFFFCFILLQFPIFLIIMDKVIFFDLWILDWKYYVCIFLFLNVYTLKYLKIKIVLSLIGHFYMIYNLIIYYNESNIVTERWTLTPLNTIICLAIIYSGIIALLAVFKNYYNKDELLKFNNALYFYYAQLLTFSILVIGYYQI